MTKEKIDLGAAFHKLKSSDDRTLLRHLVEAERYLKETQNDPYKYPYAFGMISGAVKAYLYVTSDINWKDIDTLINLPANEKQGEL